MEVRDLTQWFFRITDYAERLLGALDGLDWPERVKTMQRNWIGRSEGAEIFFRIEALPEPIPVFTTRPDTLFGATEFRVRDLILGVAAKAYQQHLAQKKTATTPPG